MERIPILSIAREELAQAVSSGEISPPSPIACSPWLAMSLMQKAIRRGRAATLLRDSPERLWRRCGVAAFEDIGVGDLATVGKVVAALERDPEIPSNWPGFVTFLNFTCQPRCAALRCSTALRKINHLVRRCGREIHRKSHILDECDNALATFEKRPIMNSTS